MSKGSHSSIPEHVYFIESWYEQEWNDNNVVTSYAGPYRNFPTVAIKRISEETDYLENHVKVIRIKLSNGDRDELHPITKKPIV